MLSAGEFPGDRPVERDLGVTRFVVLPPCIRDHHGEIGKNDSPSQEHPSGPARNEDGENHTGGSNAHRNEIPARSRRLLHTQSALGARDGEDLRGWIAHVPTVRLLTQMRSPGRFGVRFHAMGSRTYGLTEVVGTSPDGIDAAIRNAVERASQTVRHLDWFEVTDIRGYIKEGSVDHVQVTMKIGFRLEDV